MGTLHDSRKTIQEVADYIKQHAETDPEWYRYFTVEFDENNNEYQMWLSNKPSFDYEKALQKAEGEITKLNRKMKHMENAIR